MKYSKSAIGLLTAQYRSVLKKCWMINVGLFALGAALVTPSTAEAAWTVSSEVALANGSGSTWSTGTNIGTLNSVTANDINAALGNTAVNEATHAATATSATTAGSAATADFATAAGALKVGETTYNISDLTLKTDFNSLKAGTTAFTGLKIKEAVFDDTTGGKLSLNKGLSLGGDLAIGDAILGSDGAKVTAENLQVSHLYIGSSTTAIDAVDTAVTADSGNLITSGAVATAIQGAGAYDPLASLKGSGAIFENATTYKAALDTVGQKITADEVTLAGHTTAITKLNDTANVDGSVRNLVKVGAENATYSDAASYTAGTIGAAIKANKTLSADNKSRLDVLEGVGNDSIDAKIDNKFTANTATAIDTSNKLTTSALVKNYVDAAEERAKAYDPDADLKGSGKIFNGITTNKAALDKVGTEITKLEGTDAVEGSVKSDIKTLAQSATFDDDTTNPHTSINGATTISGAIKNVAGVVDGHTTAIQNITDGLENNIKATAQEGTFTNTIGESDALGAATKIGAAINNVASATDENTAKLAGLKMADGTTNAATVQQAIDSARNGVANNSLSIGSLAKDTTIGSEFDNVKVDANGHSISMVAKNGSTATNAGKFTMDANGNIKLGSEYNSTIHGIQISDSGDTVTFNGSTKNVTVANGALTADTVSAANGLTLNGTTVSAISDGTKIASEPAANNTLATTKTVYNTVKDITDTLDTYATKAEVHGNADTANIALGDAAKNATFGSTNVENGASVKLVNDTADSAEMQVITSAGVKNSVALDASGAKLGYTNGDNFDGISYAKPADTSNTGTVTMGNTTKYVQAKNGNLTATGDITATGKVKGATVEATTFTLGSQNATTIDNAGSGASGETAPEAGTLATTKTVWTAVDAAKTAATSYTSHATVPTGTTDIYSGVTTVAGALDSVGTQAMANREGIAANTTKLAGLVVDPEDPAPTVVTVQKAIDYAKKQANTFTTNTVKDLADGQVTLNKNAIADLNKDKTNAGSVDYKVYNDAQDGLLNKDSYTAGTIGAAIKANAARFDGFASETQTVAEYVDANAKDATYSGSGATKVTIADEIAKKANTADLKTAAYRDVAADFTPDPTDYHDTDIATWVAANGTNIADVTTTFKVLSKKLHTVQHDLMANGDNESSIARALGGTLATDTLPGMVKKLATEAGDAVYVKNADVHNANGAFTIGVANADPEHEFTVKGTDLTVDTANSKVSATIFKPVVSSGDKTKTTAFELSNSGFKVTSEVGGETAKNVVVADGNVTADGEVKAASFKIGDNDVTSIDTGSVLSYASTAAEGTEKVMATNATVINTVNKLATTEVKANTDAITKLNGDKTVENSVDYKVYNNAKDAVYETGESGTTTIAQAIANAKGAADTLRTDLATANKGDLVHGSNIINGTVTTAKIGANQVTWAKLATGVQTRITDNQDAIAKLNGDDDVTSVNKKIKEQASAATYTASEDATTIAGKIANNEGRIAANEAKFVGMTNDTVQESINAGVSSRILLSNPAYSPTGTQYMKTVLGDLDTYGDKAVSVGAMGQFVQEIGYNMKQDQLGWDINVDTSNDDSFAKKLTSDLYADLKYDASTNTTNRTVVSALNVAGDAIETLNGDSSTAGSVQNSIKNRVKLADGETWSDSADTGTQVYSVAATDAAIEAAASGASEDLAKVLDGTTPFSKLNVGGTTATGNGSKLSIMNSANKEMARLTNNALYLYNDGKMYVSAHKDMFKIMNADGAETFVVNNANGNIKSSGKLILNDGTSSDGSEQSLTGAKIEQITTNQTNIGNMANLHGTDNAMVNRIAGDEPGDPADNIVDALNNISASVGNVHGLATAAANGSLDTKYASQQKPANWYKDGAGNLFAGSGTDDHLAELAASIGNRNYAAGTPYLTANESVATSLVALANGLKGVADDYVTKEYFNGGTATTPATISMGANASDIVIGHASAGTTDAGTTIDVNHATGKITNSVVTAGVGAAQTTTTTELSANGFNVTHNGKTVSVADGTITFNNGKVLKDEGEGAIWTNGDFLANGNISSGASIYSGANLGVAGEATIGTNLGVGGNTTLAGTLGFGGNIFESVAKEITANSTDAELPTAKAVYDVVNDATSVEAAPKGNYAEGTVKTAVAELDGSIGDRANFNGTNYARPNSSSATDKIDVATAIQNMDTNIHAKMGDVNFDTDPAMHYVSSADTDLTTAIKSMDTNVFNAIGGLDNKYVTKAYFSAGDANNLIWMGDAASDIRIGTKKSVSGTDSLNSGVEVLADATNGDSVTIKASGATASTGITVKAGAGTTEKPAAIEIGTVGTDFTGIQVTNNGKDVTFKGTTKSATIIDGVVTAEKATVKTLEFTDGAADPTLTTATSVDNAGKDVLASGVASSGTELASTLTVKNTVEAATNLATGGFNYAAGPIKTAIASIDGAIGNRQGYRGTHYANTASDTDTTIATAIKNLDDAIYGVASDYVKVSYFNNGDTDVAATDPNYGKISMGSGANKIEIGVVDNTSKTGILIDNNPTDPAKASILMGNTTDNVTVSEGDLTATGDIKGASVESTSTITAAGDITSTGGKLVLGAQELTADKIVLYDGYDARITANTARFLAGTHLPAFADGETVADYLYANGSKALYSGSNSIANVLDAITNDDGMTLYNEVAGTRGKGLIFNETDGGGAKFENSDGTWSAVAVNDGGATGIAAQIYAIDHNNGNKGTRINVTRDAIYYTNGRTSGGDNNASDEIATLATAGNGGYEFDTDGTTITKTINQAIAENTAEIAKRTVTIGSEDLGHGVVAETATVSDGEHSAKMLTLAGATTVFDAKQIWLDKELGIDSGDLTGNPYHTAFSGAYNLTNDSTTTMTGAIMELDSAIGNRTYADTVPYLTTGENVTTSLTKLATELGNISDDYVTWDYFSGGEQDTTSPNAGRIIMGDTADKITVGRTSETTVSGNKVTTLTNGMEVNNTTGSIILGKQSVNEQGVGTLKTGLNINGTSGQIDIVSVDNNLSSNGITLDTDVVKIGTTSSDSKFEGVTVKDGVLSNVNPTDATKGSSMSSSGFAVTDGATNTLIAAGAMSTTDGTGNVTGVAATGVSVTNSSAETTLVGAGSLSTQKGSNIAGMDYTGVSVTDGTNTSIMNSTTVSMADKSGNSNTLNKSGMTVADSNGNEAKVTSSSMSVENGAKKAQMTTDVISITDGNNTTSITADAVTSSKFAFGDGSTYATGIDNVGIDVNATGATVDAYIIATTATVKASVDGMVAGIEKQIHGDQNDPTFDVTIGDYANNTIIGKSVVDAVSGERTTYAGMEVDTLNREVTLSALDNNKNGVEVDLDAANQTIELTATGKDTNNKDSETGVKIDNKNQKITLGSTDEASENTTGIEISNKDGTIAISSANDDDHTASGLTIVNDKASGKHTIDLAYNEKDNSGNVTASQGLSIDGDNNAYSLGYEDANKTTGLDIDAKNDKITLGSEDTTNDVTSGLEIDAKNHAYSLSYEDAAGKTSGLDIDAKNDKFALTAEDTTAGTKSGLEIDAKTSKFNLGASDTTAGTSYGMNMDAAQGITKFEDENHKGVTMNKGDMTVTDSATVGDATTDEYIKLENNATDGAKATFSSAAGDVEIAKGEVTADNKVTVGDDTNSVVLDKDGNVVATNSALIGSKADDGTLTGVELSKSGDAKASHSFSVEGTNGITAMYDSGIVALKDANNQATLGNGGLWVKKDTAEAGVSGTGLWAAKGTKSASYSNDGLWIEDKADPDVKKTANVGLTGLGIVDGSKSASYGIDGLQVTDGTNTSNVGPNGIYTSKDMYAEGAVNGKDLVARESFTLAGATVHSIDNSGAKVAGFTDNKGSTDTLATTASIYYNAEDAEYTGGTYTTLNADTIKDALQAVDDIIGNFPAGLNKDLVDPSKTSSNLTNGGKVEPQTILDAFNNIDSTLGTIHGLAAKRGADYKGNLASGTTVEMHLTALDDAIGDRTTITNENGSNGYEFSTQTMYVADVLTDLASQIGTAGDLGEEMNGVSAKNSVNKNIAAINSSIGDVSELKNATYAQGDTLVESIQNVDDKLVNLDTRMERAEKDLKDVHHELRRGMASMAAMSALVPNSRSTGKTSLSIGTGAYSGHNAVAVGGFHYLTDNLMFNAGAAWSNSRDAVYRVGMTYSF